MQHGPPSICTDPVNAETGLVEAAGEGVSEGTAGVPAEVQGAGVGVPVEVATAGALGDEYGVWLGPEAD